MRDFFIFTRPRKDNLLMLRIVDYLSRCWLLDIAREVPSSWELQGFDVSTSQFPVAANLPANVALGYLDAFDDIPAKFIARFNVIHVRAFAVVVKGGNVNPLLQNLARMLSMSSFTIVPL